MLIGLGHTARVGKDTIGQILVEDHGFSQIAYADALRAAALDSNEPLSELVDRVGWDIAKTEFPWARQYLVALGNAVRDHVGPDVWVDAVFRQIGSQAKNWVITDVRYENEANAVLRHGGIAVKVTRPGIEPLDNIADRALAGWDGWSSSIVNDGTIEDLRLKVKSLIG